jgi:hypothetical protein
MINTSSFYHVNQFLHKKKSKQSPFSKNQIQEFYINLIEYLYLNNINVCLSDANKLSGSGFCLINISCLSNQLYLLFCEYDFEKNSFKFYDFKMEKYFFSSKDVLVNSTYKKIFFFF